MVKKRIVSVLIVLIFAFGVMLPGIFALKDGKTAVEESNPVSFNIKDLLGKLSAKDSWNLNFYGRKALMATGDEVKKICDELKTVGKEEEEVELNTPWAEAYYEFLEETLKNDSSSTSFKKGFRLVYIDDNDVPELLIMEVKTPSSSAKVYTYYQDSVIEIGEFGSMWNMFYYAERQGEIRSYYTGFGEDFFSYYVLEDGKTEEIGNFHSYPDLDYDDYSVTLYEIDGESVTEETFNKKLDEIDRDNYESIGYEDAVFVDDMAQLKTALAQEIEALELKSSLTPQQTEALEAYEAFLEEQAEDFMESFDKTWEDYEEYEDYKGPEFTLIYLDDDEIPELAVVYGMGHTQGVYIYTLVDGKVVLVEEYGEYGCIGYVEREGIVFSSWDAHGDVHDSIYKIKGTEKELLQNSSECWNYEVDEEEEGYWVYKVDGKEVTYDEYKAALKVWDKYEEKVVSYDNCFFMLDGNIERNFNKAAAKLVFEQKDYLKSKVLSASGFSEDEILRFEYNDFDNDGSYEAFVFLGEYRETERKNYYQGEFWFVSPKECIQLGNRGRYRSIDGFMSWGRNQRYICFIPDNNFTADISQVWTVEDGRAVESGISGIGKVRYDVETRYDKSIRYLEIWRDAYDGIYDQETGTMSGHTCKPYFYDHNWSTNEFEECKSREISEEWLKSLCGFDLGAQIRAEGYEIISILELDNKIVVVNYAMPSGEGKSSRITYDNVMWDCNTGDYWKKEERGVTSWRDAGFGGTY